MKKDEGTTINIMGRPYQIKCPENEVHSLQRAATFLEDKMKHIRDTSQVLSIDRLAVIAALNIAHQFLNLENQSSDHLETIQQRLRNLHKKVDTILSEPEPAEMEFSSIE